MRTRSISRPQHIADERSVFAQSPASARFWQTRSYFTRSTEIQKKGKCKFRGKDDLSAQNDWV